MRSTLNIWWDTWDAKDEGIFKLSEKLQQTLLWLPLERVWRDLGGGRHVLSKGNIFRSRIGTMPVRQSVSIHNYIQHKVLFFYNHVNSFLCLKSTLVAAQPSTLLSRLQGQAQQPSTQPSRLQGRARAPKGRQPPSTLTSARGKASTFLTPTYRGIARSTTAATDPPTASGTRPNAGAWMAWCSTLTWKYAPGRPETVQVFTALQGWPSTEDHSIKWQMLLTRMCAMLSYDKNCSWKQICNNTKFQGYSCNNFWKKKHFHFSSNPR